MLEKNGRKKDRYNTVVENGFNEQDSGSTNNKSLIKSNMGYNIDSDDKSKTNPNILKSKKKVDFEKGPATMEVLPELKNSINLISPFSQSNHNKFLQKEDSSLIVNTIKSDRETPKAKSPLNKNKKRTSLCDKVEGQDLENLKAPNHTEAD